MFLNSKFLALAFTLRPLMRGVCRNRKVTRATTRAMTRRQGQKKGRIKSAVEYRRRGWKRNGRGMKFKCLIKSQGAKAPTSERPSPLRPAPHPACWSLRRTSSIFPPLPPPGTIQHRYLSHTCSSYTFPSSLDDLFGPRAARCGEVSGVSYWSTTDQSHLEMGLMWLSVLSPDRLP